MRKIIFIITLAVNVSILMQAQPRVPTRVIILTGKGQLTSQNVEVQMDWRGVLLTRFNQPLENATIEIVNADGKVTYQQDIDAKTDDAISIELSTTQSAPIFNPIIPNIKYIIIFLSESVSLAFTSFIIS